MRAERPMAAPPGWCCRCCRSQCLNLSHCRHRHRHHTGFTLIELLITLAIASLLSVIAVPSFQSQVQRMRRGDALVAMIQIQMAESRWRANGPQYAGLAEIGVASLSGSGHYRLAIASESPEGYRVVAVAVGSQASDAACRVFVLTVTGTDIVRTSGPEADAGNDAAANRRCWGS